MSEKPMFQVSCRLLMKQVDVTICWTAGCPTSRLFSVYIRHVIVFNLSVLTTLFLSLSCTDVSSLPPPPTPQQASQQTRSDQRSVGAVIGGMVYLPVLCLSRASCLNVSAVQIV